MRCKAPSRSHRLEELGERGKGGLIITYVPYGQHGDRVEIFTFALYFFTAAEIMSLLADASVRCQSLSVLGHAADHHPTRGFN